MKGLKDPIGLAYAVLALGFLFLFYGAGQAGGDFEVLILSLFISKIHLLHSFEFPFLTPFLCGGFLLGSDPQNLLFSVFTPFLFIFRDPHFAGQMGILLCAILFTWGMERWLKCFGIRDRRARLATGTLAACSGYLFGHWQVEGHLSSHGIAYLPWFFYFLERRFALSREARWGRWNLLGLSLVGFLLVNSGYQWIQVFLPLALGRFGAEFFRAYSTRAGRRAFLHAFGVLLISGILAIGVSLPKIGSFFAQGLGTFPRQIDIMGIIGSYRILGSRILRAFFDPSIVLHSLGESHLGGWWDWTLYVGLLTFPLFLIGFHAFHLRWKAGRGPWLDAWIGLILGAFIQLLLTRHLAMGQLFRALFPFLKSITYLYRGAFVWVIVYFSVFACGLQYAFASRKKAVLIAAFLVFPLTLIELTVVYSKGGHLRPGVEEYPSCEYRIPGEYLGVSAEWFRPGTPGENGFIPLAVKGYAPPICYNPLLGYKSTMHGSEVRFEQPPFQRDPSGKFLNLNDVGRMFGPEGKGGKWASEKWPLWPVEREGELIEFLSFKQKVKPQAFGTWRAVSYSSLLLAALIAFLPMRRRRKNEF